MFLRWLKDNIPFLGKSRQIADEPGILCSISKGRTKLSVFHCGVSIFWSGHEVTKGVGLQSAINTLGMWTDSSKADWHILEKTEDCIKAAVVFKFLPLKQIWTLRIIEDSLIDWEIVTETEEKLYIDEFRVLSLLRPFYKLWVSDYHFGDWPRSQDKWQDVFLGTSASSLAGVRFPAKDGYPLGFILEDQGNRLFSIMQVPSTAFDFYIAGFRCLNSEKNKCYPPGSYVFFSGKINLVDANSFLDAKIENIRPVPLGVKVYKGKNIRQNVRILLANMPWNKNGEWGVRAGSRWPHIKDKSEGSYLPFPFFLAYATALLENHGIQAEIIDAIAQKIPESVFRDMVVSKNIDYLVVETSIPSFYDDLDTLDKISAMGVSIILCGPNSEIYSVDFLREHRFIDFVLYGEYEFTLLELVQNLKENKSLSGVRGLIYRDGERVIKNPPAEPFDIDLLPFPHRDTLPMDKYWDLPGDMPYPSVQMLASRGCPFKCNFCLWPQVLYGGNHYRARRVENLVDEMEYLVKKRGFKSIYFDDDTFNVSKERILLLCKAIKERGLNDVPWAVMARADLMDEELLVEMKSAGLHAVKYGVESFNEALIKECDKKLNLEKTTNIIKMTKKLGIKVHLTFCFGFQGETKDTIKNTIDYGLSIDPDSVQFSILTPFPGTRLFEELDKQGRILTKDWSKYDGHYRCVFKPDNLSATDLEESKRMAYRLWADYQRKKRGFSGDVAKFCKYLKEAGLMRALKKTSSYLFYIFVKRKGYLVGSTK